MADPKRRRIMRKLRIEEISAVDRPANEYATKVLMKRAQEEQQMIASFATFEEAVDAIAKAESLPRHQAMSEAANAHPTLLRKYREAGAEMIAKAVNHEQVVTGDATMRAFEDEVLAHMRRSGLSRSAAMSEVARSRPDLLDAMRSTAP